jgi:superkiller protein 3
MQQSVKRIFQESFAPVLLVILGIFLSLIYAEYQTVRNADAITVIRIDGEPIKNAKEEMEPTGDTALLAVHEDDDPRLQEAARLVAAGNLQDAEAKYRVILAEKPNSHTFNDLGVLYLKKDEEAKALDYLNKALSTPPNYVRSYFNRALAYSHLGNSKAAIADYTAFIQQMPNNFDAHYNVGLLYLKTRDYNNAMRVFETAKGLAGGERKARAHVGLGTAYRELGKKDLAKTAFDAAIRLRPDYIEPRLELAAMEDNTPEGRKRALARYEEVFKLKPDYPPAYFSLARRHIAAGDSAAAEAAYRNAIKFNPEYRKAHYNLGLLLLSKKRYSDAWSEFEWVAKRDPRHGETHFNLARTAYGLKDNATALAEYRKAVELRGDDYPEAYLNQGLVLVALKQYKEAEESYRKAIKLNEAYPEAWYNLGMLQMRQKQLDQAGKSFRTAIQYEPRYEQAWFNLGVLAGREDKDDDAIDAYRHALEIRPNYPEARLNLAVRYAKQDRHNEAIAEYRALLEQDNTYALAWLNLGYAYLATNSLKNAEQALRHSLELEPQNVKAMKALATSLSDQDKDDDAVEVMRQAVAVDAGDPQLRALLARILLDTGKRAEARSEFSKALKLDPDNKKLVQEFNALFANAQ